jgi:ligand-binding sensor domain-containing protein
MSLRATFLLLATALVAGSCQRHSADAPTPSEDPDWIKLEIPKGREANAVFGDLDGTLVVTTYKDAYYTTDKGKTWQKSFDFASPMQGLVARHDTLVALGQAGTDAQGRHIAVRGQYYTTDFGRTWKPVGGSTYYTFGRLRQRTDSVQAAGVAYQIKLNFSPASPGSNGYYSEPSDLLKKNGSGQATLLLPAKHVIQNLYLDATNRLYVAAASCAHRTSLTDCAACQPENGLQSPAVVYVSRKPLP